MTRALALIGLVLGFSAGFQSTACTGTREPVERRKPQLSTTDRYIVCDDEGWCRKIVTRTLGGMVL